MKKLAVQNISFTSFFPNSVNEFISVPADQAFLQFFGDEFLRLLIIRFVFCSAALRLHKLFRVSHFYCSLSYQNEVFTLKPKMLYI